MHGGHGRPAECRAECDGPGRQLRHDRSAGRCTNTCCPLIRWRGRRAAPGRAPTSSSGSGPGRVAGRSSPSANAAAPSAAPRTVSSIHARRAPPGRRPARPRRRNSWPNLARSRSVALMPPSAIGLPWRSTVISASNSAPIGCHSSRRSARAAAPPPPARLPRRARRSVSTGTGKDRRADRRYATWRSSWSRRPRRAARRARAAATSTPARTADIGVEVCVILVESFPARMSSRSCTLAPANEVPASSGTIGCRPGARIERARPARIPATVEVTDFDTDISRCGVSGRMPLKYCSVITRPRCRTRNPSV